MYSDKIMCGLLYATQEPLSPFIRPPWLICEFSSPEMNNVWLLPITLLCKNPENYI